MINISEQIRKLVEEGKAEFIGKYDALEGYKAYYRVNDNGKTYYIFGVITKGNETNYHTTLQD